MYAQSLDEGKLRSMRKTRTAIFVLLTLLPLFGIISIVSASPNIGLLRVSNFLCPGEVLPGTSFPVSLDVEYAIQTLPDQATIRGAVYDGNPNFTNPLWQSDPISVSNGGDQVWNFTLNAPATEGFLSLTAYAYFLDNGTWTYFDNPVNGPGMSQRTVKIGKAANLAIGVGAPNVQVSVNDDTQPTSASGEAIFSVPVSTDVSVTVPTQVVLANSTRIIFTEWNDGIATPIRKVPIDGDINLTAQYRLQYPLTVTNGSSTEEWYDRGANVTLRAPSTIPAPWPLGVLGVTETFQSWSGDAQSTSQQVNVTMDSPKSVTAIMNTNYQPLMIPAIISAGTAVAIISFLFARPKTGRSVEDLPETAVEQERVSPTNENTPQSNPTCPMCGQITEPDWAHCIKCGTKLKNSNPSADRIAS